MSSELRWNLGPIVAMLPWRSSRQGTAVRSDNDLRVEHGEQRIEVSVARRGEERVDNGALLADIGIRDGGRTPHAPAGAAGELARGRWRAVNDGGDLVEGHAEHVVQHEGYALGGCQPVKDDEHGQSDRVDQQGFLLRIEPALGAKDGLGQTRMRLK